MGAVRSRGCHVISIRGGVVLSVVADIDVQISPDEAGFVQVGVMVSQLHIRHAGVYAWPHGMDQDVNAQDTIRQAVTSAVVAAAKAHVGNMSGGSPETMQVFPVEIDNPKSKA